MDRRNLRRTDLLDTSDWAHRELVKMLRKLTPEQRLQMVLDRIALGRSINKMAEERRRDPSA